MIDRVCKRYCVAGRVQGVFFRASTAEEGRRLGLQGWALNLSDGRVEVLACGAEDNVDALGKWLHRGPRLAKVTCVDACSEDAALFDELVRPPGAVFFQR